MWVYGGAYGDLFILYPKPYSIYLRATMKVQGLELRLRFRTLIPGVGV